MKQTLNIGKEPNFQLIIITSAVVHLILITLIVIPLKKKENEYQSYFVNLVGPTESVQEKRSTQHIPDVLSAVKGNESASKEITKPLPKADMSLEPAEKISKEIERLRAISALSKQKKKKDTEKTREIEVVRQQIHGSAVKNAGIPGAVQSLSYDSYYALITRRIWSESSSSRCSDSIGKQGITN